MGIIVAPVRERGLKYRDYRNTPVGTLVAPVRERGLKFNKPIMEAPQAPSLP